MSTLIYEAPPQSWLDKHAVELTGEFRVPIKGDLIYSHNPLYHGAPFPVTDWDAGSMNQYGGKRWIVKQKGPPPKPSPLWLKHYNVELTGECRIPKANELCVPDGHGFKERYAPYYGPYTRDEAEGNYRWILREKEPEAQVAAAAASSSSSSSVAPECPPRPTAEDMERLCKRYGRSMRLTGACEEPNGRPHVTHNGLHINGPVTTPVQHRIYGRRRWILEEDTTTKTEATREPWKLHVIHYNKLVESKDGKSFGRIKGANGRAFLLEDGRIITPETLMDDGWTWNGQPCSNAR